MGNGSRLHRKIPSAARQQNQLGFVPTYPDRVQDAPPIRSRRTGSKVSPFAILESFQSINCYPITKRTHQDKHTAKPERCWFDEYLMSIRLLLSFESCAKSCSNHRSPNDYTHTRVIPGIGELLIEDIQVNLYSRWRKRER